MNTNTLFQLIEKSDLSTAEVNALIAQQARAQQAVMRKPVVMPELVARRDELRKRLDVHDRSELHRRFNSSDFSSAEQEDTAYELDRIEFTLS